MKIVSRIIKDYKKHLSVLMCHILFCLFLSSMLIATQSNAFCVVYNTFFYSPSRSIQTQTFISTSQRSMQLTDVLNIPESISSPRSTELWLDLRGTAVNPRVATEYIIQELKDEGLLVDRIEFPIPDRVLMSDTSFQQLLNASDPFVLASEILYQPESGIPDDMLVSSQSGLSLPFGSIIEMPSDNAIAVRDPMKAMNVLTDGKWIVLDNGEEELDYDKESMRIDAISGFLDIASTATQGIWGLGTSQVDEADSGLFRQNEVQREKSSNEAAIARGGVAVQCSTKSFLLELASTLQCFHMVSSSTTVTDAGIVIQGGPDKEFTASMPTALVIPFDMTLWKAAMLVYGPEQFRAEE